MAWFSGALSTLATKIRHGAYAAIRPIVRAFRPSDPARYSYFTETPDQVLITDRGERVNFGGTKPMYRFIDQKDRKWLFKEAVDCIGRHKRSGALLTQAGYELQAAINPDTAVQAFADGIHGRGFGSFQQMVDLDSEPVDLFAWQKGQTDLPEILGPGKMQDLTDGILREHTTDWLLCNFDTKGENFLVDVDGQVRGIDKEQSFRYLNDPGAKSMSKTYQPNPNNTLYNFIFDKYAKGEIDLNLNECMQSVQKIEAMSRDEYLNIFKPYLDHKFSGKPPEQRERYEEQILERKENLRAEYEKFFSDLIKERVNSLNQRDKDLGAGEIEILKEKYGLKDPMRGFKFEDSEEIMDYDDAEFEELFEDAPVKETTHDNHPRKPVKLEALDPARREIVVRVPAADGRTAAAGEAAFQSRRVQGGRTHE